MSHGSERERARRAAGMTAGGALLGAAIMAVATTPSGGWILMAPLLPIGLFVGAIAGGLLAGTIWYSGVE